MSDGGKKNALCPICREAVMWDGNPNRPFCSRKCKTEDLYNWMSHRYAIPGRSVAGQDEEREDEDLN